jgi:hypothetical protein
MQPSSHASSSPSDFSTLKMEAILSSEMSVHTRSTQRQTPEDGILHSFHCGSVWLKIWNYRATFGEVFLLKLYCIFKMRELD